MSRKAKWQQKYGSKKSTRPEVIIVDTPDPIFKPEGIARCLHNSRYMQTTHDLRPGDPVYITDFETQTGSQIVVSDLNDGHILTDTEWTQRYEEYTAGQTLQSLIDNSVDFLYHEEHTCENCGRYLDNSCIANQYCLMQSRWIAKDQITVWHDDQLDGLIVDEKPRHYEPNFSFQMWWKRVTCQCWSCDYRKVEIRGEGLIAYCLYHELTHDDHELWPSWSSRCTFYENEADALRGELAAMKGQAKLREILL